MWNGVAGPRLRLRCWAYGARRYAFGIMGLYRISRGHQVTSPRGLAIPKMETGSFLFFFEFLTTGTSISTRPFPALSLSECQLLPHCPVLKIPPSKTTVATSLVHSCFAWQWIAYRGLGCGENNPELFWYLTLRFIDSSTSKYRSCRIWSTGCSRSLGACPRDVATRPIHSLKTVESRAVLVDRLNGRTFYGAPCFFFRAYARHL